MLSFEFATNEYINDMTVVTLETAATDTGKKDFIAVGTTVDRGEDLAVKGAVRTFLHLGVIRTPRINCFRHPPDVYIRDRRGCP